MTATVIRMDDCCRNHLAAPCVQPDMDDEHRAAIRAEGYDPDHPAVIAALECVSRTLKAHRGLVDELLPALGLRRTASLTISVDSIDGMTPHPH